MKMKIKNKIGILIIILFITSFMNGNSGNSSYKFSQLSLTSNGEIFPNKNYSIDERANSDRVIIFSADFESEWINADPDGDYYVPDYGWDIDGLCTCGQSEYPQLTHYWSQYNDSLYPFPNSGRNCAGIWWSDGNCGDYAQNEWIKTPVLDLSNYENLELKFYGIWNWEDAPSYGDHYYVKISDDGAIWYTMLDVLTIQEGNGGPAGYGWCWNEYEVSIDLDENITNFGLNSETIQIAWNSVNENGTLYDIQMLDDVRIVATPIVFYVGGSGANNYTKIQDAIDDATDGDIIFVYNGIYHEHIVINKRITLMGQNRETTIIDGDETGDVIYITADGVSIEGFKITGSGMGWNEAGIEIRSNDTTIYNNNISYNKGDGINIIRSCNNLIRNNIIMGNWVYGLYIRSHSNNNTICNNLIIDSSSDGIYIQNSEGNVISNNVITDGYGGVSLRASSYNSIINNIISNNLDGIVIAFGSCNNTVIENNLSYCNTRGLLIKESSYNNTVIFNTVAYNGWHGIDCYYSGNNNTFYYNNFINNNIQAYDTCHNTWNGSFAGNYWNDFDSAEEGAYDNDSDGIVDMPYDIRGGNNFDFYPLMYPAEKFELRFIQGWNFITLPLKNQYNASFLYNELKCNIILSWNASVQDFIIYVPGSPYDFAIENGHGYFVSLNKDFIFPLIGVRIPSVSIPLYEGWNCLGWFNENETNASSLYNEIDNCTIVLKWNTTLQDFDLYAPGTSDFVIKRGDGFLVAVTEEGIWHGEG